MKKNISLDVIPFDETSHFEGNLVSVITPNFNGARFMKRAIESVRLQDYPVEHIIVDDCSTDNSWQLLLELSHEFSFIKPFRLEFNSGPVIARNAAISVAKGRFLAFLDVDDFWLPDKLKTQIEFMQQKSCGLSFTDYRFVSETGEMIGKRHKGLNRIGWHSHHMTRNLGCLTIVIDRKIFPQFHFPNITPAYRAEDFLAWSHCIKTAGHALRCPHDLARYSVVPNSRSSHVRRAAMSVWDLYRKVEKINAATSAFYFIMYALSVTWKRYNLRPTLDRKSVDSDHSWSLLV
jgi:teichuronic acid biosynthesis glycosyltransferase TuaG